MTLSLAPYQFEIPETVSISISDNILYLSGPLGSTQLNLQKIDQRGVAAFSLSLDKKTFSIYSTCSSFLTTSRRLIENKFKGVTQGFRVNIRLKGVGYRATYSNNLLTLSVGLSHQMEFQIPQSIYILLLEPTLICIYGIDKNQVTQLAAKLTHVRPASNYSGKGVFKE